MTEEKLELFVRKSSGLVRGVGMWTVLAISFMFTVSGVCFYPFTATMYNPGSNMPLAFLIASIMMVWSTLAIVFLTVAMPRSSADYVGISRVLSPALGYWSTIMNWIGLSMVSGIVPYIAVTLGGNFFNIAGAVTQNQLFFDISNTLTTNIPVMATVTLVAMLVSAVICLAGLRIFKVIMNLIFIIPLIAMAIGIGVAAYYSTIGPLATQGAWDSVFGSGAWQEIVNVAMANGWGEYVAEAAGSATNYGWPGGWLLGATVVVLIPASISCWGYESAIFVAGEVKDARKSIPRGIILSYILLTIIYVCSVYFVYSSYGEFLSMYAYVVEGGHGIDQLVINVPTYPGWDIFMGALATAKLGPAIGLLAAIPGSWTCMTWVFVGILVLSRMLFAWSFDRFAPEFLSRVNMRFRTPHWAIITVFIIGVGGLFYSIYNPYLAMLSIFMAATFRYLFASWAAMILPFSRPDLHKTSFPWKIGPIPVATIVGFLGVVSMAYLFVVNMATTTDWNSMMYEFVIIVLGILAFTYFYARNKAKGIDVDALWREIPPA